MYNPVSTYRLQFNKDFTLQQAELIIDYLADLGISTLYASPIFAAVAGSTHGYDVVNPYVINPEIGTDEQLRRLISKLKDRGIGWIQDIVPNHMAYHTTNLWVMDVMEKGPLSPYSEVFDTTWSGDFHSGRIMAPFLGSTLEEAIGNGELKLVHRQYKLCFNYGDLYFPLNSRTYGELLRAADLPESISEFVLQLDDLHRIEDSVQYAFRWHELLLQFAALMRQAAIGVAVDNILTEVSNNAQTLHQVSNLQFYRLCHWKETDDRINYRRFFLVNGLICLNMHSEKVFALYHDRIAAFVKEGLFQGLRVDHIDGLFDPSTYLIRLRELCGPSCYIIVEKILEHGETLEDAWPIQGTTGYEFLSAVNNLFTRSSAENRFSKFYRSLNTEGSLSTHSIHDKKRYILEHHMNGELNNLTSFFLERLQSESDAAGEANSHSLEGRAFDADRVREALSLFMVQMPVYRYYGNDLPFEYAEKGRIIDLFHACRSARKDLADVFEYIASHLAGDNSSPNWLRFYQHVMQYTGPLMAKGVEDTLMYTFNRFIAHNEVGDSPEFFGLSTDEFHKLMTYRQDHWPLALNATSTHDTKRGEDVRMRLNVLPDIAEDWISHVKSWMDLNQSFKVDGSPDANDEYFIYQNLIGIYSFNDQTDLTGRMNEFMKKAVREAKRHSNWSQPNGAYENSIVSFLDAILSSDEFMSSFRAFCRTVSDFGMINSFCQLALKVMCPGVPDIYQGTAAWDLSLVDPDNRRSVDFDFQRRQLDSGISFRNAWSVRDDGAIKGGILQKLLSIRSKFEKLFAEGQYIPLKVEGRRSEHCLAFARQLGKQWIIVAIPLNGARFMHSAEEWNQHWGDTEVVLPDHAPVNGRNLISETTVDTPRVIKLADAFAEFPFSVLLLEEESTQRRAGIVLHISSLPGRFSIGDLGPEARKFADFLHASRQRIWQMLPINPPQRSAAYSPYSSYSAMAGSILFISPDDLINDGLLDESFINKIKNSLSADYDASIAMKASMLKQAYDNFRKNAHPGMTHEYEEFLEGESYWLNDFALFEIIREQHDGLAWYEWPMPLRDRDPAALMAVRDAAAAEIDRVMWSQYIFWRQWRRLRKYCHDRDIQLMGDLPFYLDRDSADVWAHRDLFSVSRDGAQLAIAGVPPDYFSADGQLWGMPVYNWEAMRKDNYSWFVKRIKRNFKFFDVLRLDHFRAFASYWEVPAGQPTAKGGAWKKGPGHELFDALEKLCGKTELIAEDLGEITPDVYALRDSLNMPGMFVLQFAFGSNIATTLHIPHRHTSNGVVYTGTHDNNTARGWFRKELDKESHARLSRYSGKRVTAGNVAEVLIELAYRSVANTAMVPMQDILSLNERARLNTPATVNKQNWVWRMPAMPGPEIIDQLSELSRTFGR
ncbi:malto-oligosyltrehalose synthase [Chryseolinea sp. T2]|uniref:malto-oligosyltrehalose synthase n=1 Tax=Chryseolinea sp. T2 TaxID=3129255 RepID=UPI0030769EC5